MGSELCQPTSTLQDAVLYTGIALASIGLGGTRYTLATMGANQFDKPKNQASFFNWYFFTLYSTTAVALTVIVYIEDNAGWRWGFGLCVLTNIIALAVFLTGTRFYNFDKPQGSPFVALARVVVAAFRKRKLQLSSESKDYYDGHDGLKEGVVTGTLSTSCRYKLYRVNYYYIEKLCYLTKLMLSDKCLYCQRVNLGHLRFIVWRKTTISFFFVF